MWKGTPVIARGVPAGDEEGELEGDATSLGLELDEGEVAVDGLEAGELLAVLDEVVHCAAVSIRLASRTAGRHNHFIVARSLIEGIDGSDQQLLVR